MTAVLMFINFKYLLHLQPAPSLWYSPSMPLKRFPLAGTAGDALFVRQQDDYSCGPASLATVAKLYEVGLDYDEIRKLVQPSPVDGTSQPKIAEVAAKILPFETAGEATYQGGIAVANIMQEGEGHYVVFLAKEGDKVVYYEPYWHELVVEDITKIEWHSGDNRVQKWSANFAPLKDMSIDDWLKYAEPKAPAAASAPPAPKP